MKKKIEGIIPVMLTPFSEEDMIDYESLENLIEWYIRHGADALFAVCQSSEMQFLSLQEKSELASFVVEHVRGRVPVLVSGHTDDTPYDQICELERGIHAGADGLVLVSNHLDPENKGPEIFIGNVRWLLSRLPADLPLGIYECPAPYRRLVSDEELQFLVDTERFYFMKDVSCDLETVKRRVAITKDSDMVILNANAAIAWDAMKAGSRGFNGVFTNIHPDLYQWLYTSGGKYPEMAQELASFLVLAACAEPYGYPVIAKMYHQRNGTIKSIRSRAITYNIYEKVWGIEPILDHLIAGTEAFRKKIALLD